jgi:ABC-type phosphate transport system permease subunit
MEHHSVDKCPQEVRIKQVESDGRETLVQLAILGSDVNYIKTAVDKIEHLIVDKYVTKDEFQPIKRIVYGVTSLILTSVIVALIALVVHSG